MSRTEVTIARRPQDIAAVQQLCRDSVAWLVDEFPQMREKILICFEPVKWEQTLAELPEVHARPQGAMLLGRTDSVPVGCIMYHQMSPGVSEVKRLYVSTQARGGGVASRLVERVMEAARADGYSEMRLDTARFLTAAIGLYRKHGFEDSSDAIDLPPELNDIAMFMHRAL